MKLAVIALQLIWWAMEVVITSLPLCSTKTSNLLCISLGRVASWLPQALNTLRQRPKKYHHLHTHLDITSALTLCKSQLLQTPAFRASCAGKHVLPQSNCSDSYWYLLSKLQFVSQTICRHVFFYPHNKAMQSKRLNMRTSPMEWYLRP